MVLAFLLSARPHHDKAAGKSITYEVMGKHPRSHAKGRSGCHAPGDSKIAAKRAARRAVSPR